MVDGTTLDGILPRRSFPTPGSDYGHSLSPTVRRVGILNLRTVVGDPLERSFRTGQLGTLLTPGSVVEVTLEHSLGLGLLGRFDVSLRTDDKFGDLRPY